MITNFQIFFKKDLELSETENEKIIYLKDQYWHHPIEAHKKWRKENLNNDDCHLWLATKEGEIVAYLNLVFISANIGNKHIPLIGIGNVCTDKTFEGQGIGLLLMHVCNYYIQQLQMLSILLCKPSLLKFYQKSGWVKYDGKVFLKGTFFDGLTMLNKPFNESSIDIERNF